jgi:excisionase family DNA binding protein
MSNVDIEDSPIEHASRPALEKLAYTYAEACHVLGVKRCTVYKMIAEGTFRKAAFAGRLVILREDIDRLLSGLPPLTGTVGHPERHQRGGYRGPRMKLTPEERRANDQANGRLGGLATAAKASASEEA